MPTYLARPSLRTLISSPGILANTNPRARALQIIPFCYPIFLIWNVLWKFVNLLHKFATKITGKNFCDKNLFRCLGKWLGLPVRRTLSGHQHPACTRIWRELSFGLDHARTLKLCSKTATSFPSPLATLGHKGITPKLWQGHLRLGQHQGTAATSSQALPGEETPYLQ